MQILANVKNLNFKLQLEDKKDWNNNLIMFKVFFDFPMRQNSDEHKYYYKRLMDGALKIESTDGKFLFEKKKEKLKLDYYEVINNVMRIVKPILDRG